MMVKSVLLPLDPLAAFRSLFTRKIGAWWPPAAAPHRGPDERDFSAARTDGSTNARAAGTRWSSARFDPGTARTAFCSIFSLRPARSRPTEVEITFAAEESGTRVTVTHRPKPGSADLWEERAPRYAAGSWDMVLAALSRAAA